MDPIFDNISFSGNAYHEDLFADLGDGITMDNHFAATTSSNNSSFDEMQPHTVSPQDLWATDEFVTSAPPSTAFPPLNTPGSEFLDSPALTGGLDTTPMEDGFLDAQLNSNEIEQWPSLFPEDATANYKVTASPAIVQNNSFDSLTNVRPSLPTSSPSMARQKSSPGRPPMTAAHLRKHSLTSGINKQPAKARKSLPDIMIESDDDKETAKRKKNTAAARKSRERKQMIVDSQAVEIDRLRSMVIALGGNPDP